jgi:HEAT repeat protein
MIASASPVQAIHHARAGMRQSAIRRKLQAVAAGKTTHISIVSADLRSLAPKALEEVTAGMRADSLPLQLLQVAFENSGVADEVIDRLGVKNIHDRVSSTRLIGALRMYEATPWLRPLLTARDASVVDAAARALGKIGGARSATALLLAIQRRGLNRRLVSELARGAPDLFIEAELGKRQRPAVRPALAIAAGLRRRHTAISPLIDLLQHGSRRERVISCRALGWIGAGTAVPVIAGVLGDRDWKIRMSAAKALGALRSSSSRRALEELYGDPNPRVRKAAQQAVRRLPDGA